VRIEDLDRPRERPGAADQILRSLEAFGLHWDGPVLRQSTRAGAYGEALDRLHRLGLTRRCACSRSVLATLVQNQGRPAGEELFHPPQCVLGGTEPAPGYAIRLRVPDRNVEFLDRAQGPVRVNVARTVGDFVLRRRDGPFAYQLAVVVDDAEQGITDVVRGSDLLAGTLRQLLLQEALGLPRPAYLHLPLAVDDRGLKLSKSEGAPAAGWLAPGEMIVAVLGFLRQQPPPGLAQAGLDDLWQWAVAHWRPDRFAGLGACRVHGSAVQDGIEEDSTNDDG